MNQYIPEEEPMAEYSYRFDRHPETGWSLLRLLCKADRPERNTEIAFCPQIGSNLISFVVGGTDYLVDVDQRGDRKLILGTPILYPSPNRVRNARFTFEGQTFVFEPNDGTNFLHGLVRERPWACETPVIGDDGISVMTRIVFAPGRTIYERFPIHNELELTYTVSPGRVRFGFCVRNLDAQRRLPFGLAIHPYFRVLGPRDQVWIQVPAQKWMEAENLLPTGRLLDLEAGPADLRQPTPLSELDLDDVFWGMRKEAPQRIEYRALGKQVTLTADDFFTHSVVYTPAGRPFFCLENQSCSTDAHNLYAQGLQKAAHLTILDPGESISAGIEIMVSDL